MKYEIHLKDKDRPVSLEADKVYVESGWLIIEKDSRRIGEFMGGSWVGWVEEQPVEADVCSSDLRG